MERGLYTHLARINQVRVRRGAQWCHGAAGVAGVSFTQVRQHFRLGYRVATGGKFLPPARA